MAKSTDKQPAEFEEKLIEVSRVAKKTKGGNQMGFTALMVVGDGKGKVGIGLGKAKDVMTAVQKGTRQAKRKMIQVPINGTTIPFAIESEHSAGRVLLKPASKGSGVIAGGPVRAVVEAAGIKDVSAKILGSQNKASSVYATFEALIKIKKIVEIKGIKVKPTTLVTTDQLEAVKPVAFAQSSSSNACSSKNEKNKLKKAQPTRLMAAVSKKPQKMETAKVFNAKAKNTDKKAKIAKETK